MKRVTNHVSLTGRICAETLHAKPVFLTAATVLVLAGRTECADYIATDLGTLGGSASQAMAINKAGSIVGISTVEVGSFEFHAFLWTKANGMQDLGIIGEANGINNAGRIVGSAGEVFVGAGEAFLWTAKNGMQDLGILGGHSVAMGINDAGAVVGWSTPDTGVGFNAFLWTKQNGFQDLGNLGRPLSAANAINEAGAVVGWSLNEITIDAFLWTKQNGIQDLGTLGGEFCEANAINNAEWVVGEAHTGNDFPFRSAFLWTKPTGMQNIGTLGGFGAGAYGINNAGQVVGWSTFSKSPAERETRHAFVWMAANGMQDLGSSGEAEAFAINDAGLIVGVAGGHAYLWQPTN